VLDGDERDQGFAADIHIGLRIWALNVRAAGEIN
jgi:hypothetical protein